MRAGDSVLDSLLYEPKHRRIAMATLFVLLVLAVGFVAIGTWVESAAALLVFGIAFLAASIAFVGKLLVVSHVHIRGAAGRLEALNDRYDETARWLERFDADTRESFLVAKRRLDAGDTGRTELQGAITSLAADTPRLKAFDELGATTPRLVAIEQLTGRFDARAAAMDTRGDAVEASIEQLKASQAEALAKTDARFTTSVEELREQLKVIASIIDRVETIEGALERFDAMQAEMERIDGHAAEQSQAARAEAMEELTKTRAELDDQMRLLNGRVTKLDGDHDRKRMSAVHAAREEVGESVAKLKRRVDEASQLSARLRGDGYVQFPRVLSQNAIEAATSFGVKATSGHLKYLERKLQVIEGICEGRLAGSVDDAIGRVLAGHLVRGKELRILEIGVLFGVGAAFMHHALAPRHDRVRLALLDPFQGYYGKDHLDPLTGLPVTRAAVERNMARCGIAAEDVEIFEGFSHEDSIRSSAEQAGPFHIIVIDGDHSAEGVRTDFEGYADMLRPGGLLVIDDYGSEDWPAVTAFVDDTVKSDPRFKPVAVIGKTAVFKRARSAGGKKPARQASSPKADQSDATKTAAAQPNAKDAQRKQAATSKPAASDDTGEAGDPPVPIVKSQRRSKPSAKRASKKSAVPAGGSDTGDADS